MCGSYSLFLMSVSYPPRNIVKYESQLRQYIVYIIVLLSEENLVKVLRVEEETNIKWPML